MDVPSTAESEARRQFTRIAEGQVNRDRIAVLHIGAHRTALAVGAPGEPPAVLALNIGSAKTAEDHFRHDLPAPIEMEDAIAVVEDEVTRARDSAAGSDLFTMDEAIRQIAQIAGARAGADMSLSVEAVEQTFDRLVRVVLGRPAASEGLPGAGFAATLLILRELMHHLQFSSITVKA